jgi:Fur family ferric uptake transcriptional regulator
MNKIKASTRNTKQRSLILKILEQKAGPVAAPEILKLAKAKIPDINKTTVYRVLERLLAEEQVELVNLKSGVAYYELAQEDHHHHHHFVCNACNKIFCLEGCTLALKNLAPKGFLMTGHDLTIRGICPNCR